MKKSRFFWTCCRARSLPVLLLLAAVAFSTLIPLGHALEDPSKLRTEVGVQTQLGAKVDLSLPFTDSDGKRTSLGELVRPGIPTILIPMYYDCPRLCGLIVQGAMALVNSLDLHLGREYQVIAFSFDPAEKPELAAAKRNNVAKELAHPDRIAGWHFLVGEESSSHELLTQIGFRVKRDEDEWAHSSAIMILTPQGEISQYFTGIEFPPFDVKLSLVEASKGGIGTAIDHLLLFCFRFDPSKGKYTWAAVNTLRIGVLLSVLLCACAVWWFSRRPRGRVAG